MNLNDSVMTVAVGVNNSICGSKTLSQTRFQITPTISKQGKKRKTLFGSEQQKRSRITGALWFAADNRSYLLAPRQKYVGLYSVLLKQRSELCRLQCFWLCSHYIKGFVLDNVFYWRTLTSLGNSCIPNLYFHIFKSASSQTQVSTNKESGNNMTK